MLARALTNYEHDPVHVLTNSLSLSTERQGIRTKRMNSALSLYFFVAEVTAVSLQMQFDCYCNYMSIDMPQQSREVILSKEMSQSLPR